MSIARTLLARRYPGRLTFLHYARTPTDVIYHDELMAMRAATERFTLTFGYTRWPGDGTLDGHFQAEHLRATAPGYATAAAYVCGPASLTTAVSEQWTADGIADRLRVEHYGLAPYHRDDKRAAGELRFTRSGLRVPGNGSTLLEQAEAAGLRPEFGCRMGVCHTCASVKNAGTVRDVRTGVTSAEPGERVQLCVTAPVGDVDIAI
jgi:stearoyl-CoA 9-desaturase NADPH oxidoreductase